jgi:hypothetical protein
MAESMVIELTRPGASASICSTTPLPMLNPTRWALEMEAAETQEVAHAPG